MEIKLFLKNLIRKGNFTLPNIVGLALSLAILLIISGYVFNEFQYDKFNEKYEHIVRLTQKYKKGEANFARCGYNFGPELKKEYGGIIDFVRLRNETQTIKIGNNKFKEEYFYYADSSFFNVFDFKFIFGDKRQALIYPRTIVLTQETSLKYFGNSSPVGKTVMIYNSNLNADQIYTVKGVIEVPASTHFNFNLLCSMSSITPPKGGDAWNAVWFYTYFLLDKNVNYLNLQAELPNFLDTKVPHEGTEKYSDQLEMQLQSLSSIHLFKSVDREMKENGDIKHVMTLLFSAIIIFIISTFNFINISNSETIKKIKDLSIREALGFTKLELTYFKWRESLVHIILVLIIAIVLFVLGLGFINAFYKINFHLTTSNIVFLIGVILVVFILLNIVTLLFHYGLIKNIRIENILKTEKLPFGTFNYLKSTILFVQLLLSITMIGAVIVIFSQLQFIKHKDIGLNTDNVFLIEGNLGRVNKWYGKFKGELIKNSAIKDVIAVFERPSYRILDGSEVSLLRSGNEEKQILHILSADFNFIDFFNIKLLAGRGFSKEYSTDSSSFIINEAAAHKLGFNDPNDAIGHMVNLGMLNQNGKIIGVTADFCYSSLHNSVDPYIIFLYPPIWYNILVNVSDGKYTQVKEYIKNVWNDICPDSAFDLIPLDNKFSNLYAKEHKFFRLMISLCILSIILSCYGLYCFISSNSLEKLKEFGIRKVFGASIFSIAMIPIRNVLVYSVLVSLVASPLIYFTMNQWLQNFAYRINIDLKIYLMALILIIVISLTSVLKVIINVAYSTPMKSLRNE